MVIFDLTICQYKDHIFCCILFLQSVRNAKEVSVMREMLLSLTRVAPEVLRRSSFRVVLHGWPAAAAVIAVGATVVAVTALLRDSRCAGSAA